MSHQDFPTFAQVYCKSSLRLVLLSFTFIQIVLFLKNVSKMPDRMIKGTRQDPTSLLLNNVTS